MTEPKREGRLERLERMIADINLQVRTHLDAFRQDRSTAQRERQEQRGKIERVIAKQTKAEGALDRVESDLKELKPKVDDAAADIATLTANQSVIRADVGVLKAVRAKEDIKEYRAEGARALWKKQWALIVVFVGIIVGVIGIARDWWTKIPWGK